MTRPAENPPSPGQRTTLGRLGGLAPGEAERGERVLWLSGDGYRAALFHLGALTRLNELGLLAQTGTVAARLRRQHRRGAAGDAGRLAASRAAARTGTSGSPQPLRALAGRRRAEGRGVPRRRPFPGSAGEAALEERFARELIGPLGGEPGAAAALRLRRLRAWR